MPTFRHLTEQDLPIVMEVWTSLEDHYAHPIGGRWDAIKIHAELMGGDCLGAFGDDGELQAFCLLRRVPGVREIRLLATRERLHRTGAMRALVRSIINDLAPGEAIWLEVHAGNLPAISLYETLGFTLQGERQGYYSDGGKALLYEYRL